MEAKCTLSVWVCADMASAVDAGWTMTRQKWAADPHAINAYLLLKVFSLVLGSGGVFLLVILVHVSLGLGHQLCNLLLCCLFLGSICLCCRSLQQSSSVALRPATKERLRRKA